MSHVGTEDQGAQALFGRMRQLDGLFRWAAPDRYERMKQQPWNKLVGGEHPIAAGRFS